MRYEIHLHSSRCRLQNRYAQQTRLTESKNATGRREGEAWAGVSHMPGASVTLEDSVLRIRRGGQASGSSLGCHRAT